MTHIKSTESNEILSEIIDFINRKTILLTYQERAHVPEIKYYLVSKILQEYTIPLIWVCWSEPSTAVKKKLEIFGCELKKTYIIDTVGTVVENEHTILHTPKNYSGMLITIQRLMRDEKYILVLDSLDVINGIENKEAFISFLSTLLRRSRDSGVTMLSSIRVDIHETEIQKILLSLFDLVFSISEDKIQIKGDVGRRDVFYEIKDNKLLLKPFSTIDIIKIEEIFNLPAEEIKRLDEIVKKQFDLNKDILD